MDKHIEMESQIWDYIDGQGSAEERSVIERLVREQAEWKQRYAELLDVHQLMASTELEEPSMRFTRNVMDEIGKLHVAPAAKNYINRRVIFGIMSFFFAILIGFLIYGFGQMEWSTTTTALNVDVKIPEVDFSKFLNNTYVNVFMVLNAIVGLILFDRYLSSKRPAKMQRMG